VGSRIRRFEVGVVYSVAIRCNDREFLFRPNHDPANPLLEAGCAPRSLDPKNDLVPRQSVINLVGACLGRALAKHPIRIHWFECNLDHLHVGFSVDDEAMRENVVPFFRMVESGIARQTNRLWARENHVFGERYRATPCLDDDAAEQQMIYALTNAVKDGQVERVAKSPFFSTAAWHRVDGASAGPHRYWYFDYASWWRKGGPRKTNRLKDFLAWIEIEIAPLPHLRALTAHQRQTRLRHQLRKIELTTAERLAAEGRTAVGFETLRRLDPRDRPRNPKTSGRQPLCHASEPAARMMFKREWREFLREYRRASIDYQVGYHGREFPEGSYRPPLITPYSASRL
jgi:hypothetical protein